MGSGAGLTAPTSRSGAGSSGGGGDDRSTVNEPVKVPVYGHAGAHAAADAADKVPAMAARPVSKGAPFLGDPANGGAVLPGLPPVVGALNAKVASYRESSVFGVSVERVFDMIPKHRAGRVAWFLAWTVAVLIVGVYVGDYRADANPEMNQWCVMQAKECKRQADNCARGVPEVIESADGEAAAIGGGGVGAVAPHIEQMHQEWTALRDNRANTIQNLKELRKQVICHERMVIQQRLRGARDVDRISGFMLKLEKAQREYDELEKVVSVVYPEVIPEVKEMDQTDPPGCIKLASLKGGGRHGKKLLEA